jgi:hypothetical protein
MFGAGRRWIPVPRVRRPRATVILLLLAVATAASGCRNAGGDDPAAAATPTGFTTYQAPRYSIAYPAGWQLSEKPSATGGPPVLSILGPAGTGGFPPQIAVGHDTNYPSDFDDAMEVYRLTAIGQTGTVVSDQPIQLAGAERAQRTEYTEPQQDRDGQQYTIRVVDLHVLTPAHTMFDVLVRAPQEDFDGAQLTQALNTFRVK